MAIDEYVSGQALTEALVSSGSKAIGDAKDLKGRYRIDRSRLAYMLYDDGDLSTQISSELFKMHWPNTAFTLSSTGEETNLIKVPCLINPTTFKERVQAHYSSRSVLGLSHDKVQYIRTGSRRINFSLFFNAHILARILDLGNEDLDIAGLMMLARNFYFGLAMPRAPRQAPPYVVFRWPGAGIDFWGYVEEVQSSYERFSQTGEPIEFTLDIAMIEQPRDLMTTGSVAKNGMTRAAQNGK